MRVDLWKRPILDDRADAARRRLELLGVTLAGGDSRTPSEQPVGPAPPAERFVTEEAHSVRDARHRAQPARRVVGDVHDRLPIRIQGLLDSGGFTAHHVLVVITVVVALVCLSAWWVVSSRPSPVEPLSAPVVTAPASPPAATPSGAQASPPASPGSATQPSPSSTPAGGADTSEVVVDVTGKVRRPGIVSLPTGARVADAVAEAGGARPGADLSTINLARVLTDGEQILVGVAPVSPGPDAAAGPTGATPGAPVAPVDLNTATLQQLDTLPDIGPITAQSILDWRTQNGSFTSVDELLEVSGIGEVTLAGLRELVTI